MASPFWRRLKSRLILFCDLSLARRSQQPEQQSFDQQAFFSSFAFSLYVEIHILMNWHAFKLLLVERDVEYGLLLLRRKTAREVGAEFRFQ
jgi:hypothetical protein